MKKFNFLLSLSIILIFFNIYFSFVSVNSREIGVSVRVIEGENISIEKQDIDRISIKDLITGKAIIELEKKDVIVTLSVVVFIILIVYIIIKLRNKRKNQINSRQII